SSDLTDRSTVSGLVPDRAWWTNSRSSKSVRLGPSVCWAEARRTWSSLREAREALVSGVSGSGDSELIDLAFLSVRSEVQRADALGLPAGQDGGRSRFVLLRQCDAAVVAAGSRGLRGRPVVDGDLAQSTQRVGFDESARGIIAALQQGAVGADGPQGTVGMVIAACGGESAASC